MNQELIYKDITPVEENTSTPETTSTHETTPVDFANDNTSFIYDILHILDDIYIYGRTHIENNFFNLASNEDFNLVYPNIYIGNYSISTNYELLKGLGITHIISVIPTINPAFKDKFKYLHIQAYDDDYQDIKMYFDETNLFIKNCLHEGGRILIHCMAGRSRSVTIFIAFLIFIIKGGINQCIVILNNENNKHNINNDVCNIIEYNKLIDSKKQHIEYKDNSNYNHNHNHNYNYNSKKNENRNNLFDEKISSIENEIPRLSKKEENFVLYKKQKMITDIDELISNYKILKKELDNYKKQIFIETKETKETEETKETQELIKNMKIEFSSKMLKEILQYVKSHRSCISPNAHFINQLGDLLF